MELSKIVHYIANPDEALDINLLEDLIDWTSHWIYTLELELADDDFTVDTVHADLIKKHDKVNKAEAELKLTPEYRGRKKKEILLKSIKAYRNNIRKKRDRMTGFR